MPEIRPNNELVAVAWLGGVNGISPAQVSTTLPRDNSTWAASGFLEVTTVGGSSDIYVPMRRPIIRINAWACSATSSKQVPWGKANNLLELVDKGCRASNQQRIVQLPDGRNPVDVKAAFTLGEPQKVPSDNGSYARYYVDLAIHWVEAL